MRERWGDVVRAYEAELTLLEHARTQFRRASDAILDEVIAALRALESPPESETRQHEDAVFVGARSDIHRWACEDVEGLTMELHAWIASAFGGPPGILRLGIWLDGLGTLVQGRDQDWIEVARAALPADTPGVSGCSDDEDLVGDGDTWVRVASIDLTSGVPAKATALLLAKAGHEALHAVVAASAEVRSAKETLLRCRDWLAALAAEADLPLVPKAGLGSWRGRPYVQVGSQDPVWVALHPTGEVCGHGSRGTRARMQRAARALSVDVEESEGGLQVRLCGGSERAGIEDAVRRFFTAVLRA